MLICRRQSNLNSNNELLVMHRHVVMGNVSIYGVMRYILKKCMKLNVLTITSVLPVRQFPSEFMIHIPYLYKTSLTLHPYNILYDSVIPCGKFLIKQKHKKNLLTQHYFLSKDYKSTHCNYRLIYLRTVFNF